MALHPLEIKLAAAWPPPEWQDVTVLLAVSGGADSVAMLRALAALKTAGEGRLVAAHVNHHLRGPGADADEAFVVDLCRGLGVPCEVGRVTIGRTPGSGGQGIESAARRARYAFLQQTAAQTGARYVVAAHTADDQAETILHRVLRGTGVRGLAGMARARPLGPVTLLRPLLGIRRAELLAYLADLRQPFCQDSSNRDLRFTRNRIRHELLPRLAEQFNAEVVDALLRLGMLAGEAQAVIDRQVHDLMDRGVRQTGSGAVQIERRPLADQPRHLVRELLMALWRRQRWPMRAMGFHEWNLLASMASPGPDGPADAVRKRVFPGNVSAEVTADALRLVQT